MFINKLNEAVAEAAETQAWLEFAVQCGYLEKKEIGKELYLEYDEILRMLVDMVVHSADWILVKASRGPQS